MVQPRAGQGAVQIALRLPADLRDRVRAAAEAAGRSINSEIIATLEERYPAAPPFKPQEFIEMMRLYVLAGSDDEDMKRRAAEANDVLATFEETKRTKLMVLDEIGARASGAKVVAALSVPVSPVQL